MQKGPLFGIGSGKPGRHSGSSAVLEAPGLVPGCDDFAVMGQPIGQRRRHLGVAEDARPFAEAEIVVTMIEVHS